MVIFQPYRYLMRTAIKNNGSFIFGKTLDVGTGSFSRYRPFFKSEEYLSLDIDPGLNPDIVGTADSIPSGDKSFDSLVCTGVIGDLFDPSKALREFYRVLRPGGHLILTDNFFGAIHNEPFDYYRFTNFYLEKIVKDAGFNLVAMERVGGFFSLRAQVLIEYLVRRWDLYDRPFYGRICHKLFSFYGRLMIFFDYFDKSEANKKFAIAWLIMAIK